MLAKYIYHPSRQEFIGAVLDGEKLLTLGAEQTEHEIIIWCKQALRVKPWIAGNPRVNDMYDRAISH